MITIKPISLCAIFNDCRAKIRTTSHIVLKMLCMCFDLQCMETLGFIPLCSDYCKSARAFYCRITRGEINSIEFSLCEKQHAHTSSEFLHQAILFALWKEVKMAVTSRRKTLFFCGWLNSKRAPLHWKLNSVEFWSARAILFRFVQSIGLVYQTA